MRICLRLTSPSNSSTTAASCGGTSVLRQNTPRSSCASATSALDSTTPLRWPRCTPLLLVNSSARTPTARYPRNRRPKSSRRIGGWHRAMGRWRSWAILPWTSASTSTINLRRWSTTSPKMPRPLAASRNCIMPLRLSGKDPVRTGNLTSFGCAVLKGIARNKRCVP